MVLLCSSRKLLALKAKVNRKTPPKLSPAGPNLFLSLPFLPKRQPLHPHQLFHPLKRRRHRRELNLSYVSRLVSSRRKNFCPPWWHWGLVVWP